MEFGERIYLASAILHCRNNTKLACQKTYSMLTETKRRVVEKGNGYLPLILFLFCERNLEDVML